MNRGVLFRTFGKDVEISVLFRSIYVMTSLVLNFSVLMYIPASPGVPLGFTSSLRALGEGPQHNILHVKK